jgi:hypothetical protein
MVIPHFVYNQSETTIPLIVYLMVAYVNVRLKQNKEIVLSGQSIDKSYKSFSSKAPMIFDTFFFFFHKYLTFVRFNTFVTTLLPILLLYCKYRPVILFTLGLIYQLILPCCSIDTACNMVYNK